MSRINDITGRLRTKTTVHRYLEVVHAAESKMLIPDGDPEYWKLIPSYEYSVCPFCGLPCKEQIDTYSLRHWVLRASQGDSVYSRRGQSESCEHLVIAQAFINLEGKKPRPNEPEELRRGVIELPPEAPFVAGFLLEGPEPCTAVIHSLPICRIEGDAFVPAYTLYVVAYFAEQREVRLRKRLSLRGFKPEYDRRTMLPWPIADGEFPEWWDLDRRSKMADLATRTAQRNEGKIDAFRQLLTS
jgi:hypothetical protein